MKSSPVSQTLRDGVYTLTIETVSVLMWDLSFQITNQ
jgi:hypothetical protein